MIKKKLQVCLQTRLNIFVYPLFTYMNKINNMKNLTVLEKILTINISLLIIAANTTYMKHYLMI